VKSWVVAAVATTLLAGVALAGFRDYPPLLAALTGSSLGLLVLIAGLSFRRLRRELSTPTFTVEEGLPDETARSAPPGKEDQGRDQEQIDESTERPAVEK
jgi:hypothetical protein